MSPYLKKPLEAWWYFTLLLITSLYSCSFNPIAKLNSLIVSLVSDAMKFVTVWNLQWSCACKTTKHASQVNRSEPTQRSIDHIDDNEINPPTEDEMVSYLKTDVPECCRALVIEKLTLYEVCIENPPHLTVFSDGPAAPRKCYSCLRCSGQHYF